MLRRSLGVLGGNMVPMHDWIIREPLCQNYDGWRILDSPSMTRFECFVSDVGGYVRHLDPIIDDPRLSHRQRVCRLYRWALKEIRHYITFENAYKFNLAYKVVRNRFERYRYVTDATMCDMMIRETQKYLRETCAAHTIYRYNAGAKDNVLYHAAPMFYPDHAQCYDHWTPVEVFWYDDCKVHRYHAHHPQTSAATAVSGECWERFGEAREHRSWWRVFHMPILFAAFTISNAWYLGLLNQRDMEVDPDFDKMTKHFNPCLRQAIEAEERSMRAMNATSTFHHDWDLVMGYVKQKHGWINAMGRFRNPEGERAVDPAGG